jgi:hypothetical protein
VTAVLALDKPWYGAASAASAPQRLALYGAQKVVESKRDDDGGRHGCGIKNYRYCLALKFVLWIDGIAALSIVDPIP